MPLRAMTFFEMEVEENLPERVIRGGERVQRCRIEERHGAVLGFDE